MGRLLYKEKITPSAFPKNKKKKERRRDETPPVSVPSSLFFLCLLQSLLLAAGARLYALGNRAVDVVVRDPALVVGLAGGLGAGEGISGVDGLLDGLLGGARSLGLGEQGLDPGLVDEEEGATENGSEDKVQEDAREAIGVSKRKSQREREDQGRSELHLRVKEAGGGLDNGRLAIVSGDLEDVALLVGEDGQQTQTNILRHHIEGKRVRNRLGLAGLDLQAVLHGREVAHDALVGGGALGQVLGGPQGAIGKDDLDGVVLLVGDLDQSGRGSAVDQLDAQDVRVGERGPDVGIEGGRRLDIEVGRSILEVLRLRL